MSNSRKATRGRFLSYFWRSGAATFGLYWPNEAKFSWRKLFFLALLTVFFSCVLAAIGWTVNNAWESRRGVSLGNDFTLNIWCNQSADSDSDSDSDYCKEQVARAEGRYESPVDIAQSQSIDKNTVGVGVLKNGVEKISLEVTSTRRELLSLLGDIKKSADKRVENALNQNNSNLEVGLAARYLELYKAEKRSAEKVRVAQLELNARVANQSKDRREGVHLEEKWKALIRKSEKMAEEIQTDSEAKELIRAIKQAEVKVNEAVQYSEERGTSTQPEQEQTIAQAESRNRSGETDRAVVTTHITAPITLPQYGPATGLGVRTEALASGKLAKKLQSIFGQGDPNHILAIDSGDMPREVAKHYTTKFNGPVFERVQEIFNSKGFDAGRVDGILGPQGEAAVRRYQESIGSSPTGKLTQNLIEEIFEKSNVYEPKMAVLPNLPNLPNLPPTNSGAPEIGLTSTPRPSAIEHAVTVGVPKIGLASMPSSSAMEHVQRLFKQPPSATAARSLDSHTNPVKDRASLGDQGAGNVQSMGDSRWNQVGVGVFPEVSGFSNNSGSTDQMGSMRSSQTEIQSQGSTLFQSSGTTTATINRTPSPIFGTTMPGFGGYGAGSQSWRVQDGAAGFQSGSGGFNFPSGIPNVPKLK